MLQFFCDTSPDQQTKKEDLHKAGKATGQTKLTFAQKIKITEVCYIVYTVAISFLLRNVYQALLMLIYVM